MAAELMTEGVFTNVMEYEIRPGFMDEYLKIYKENAEASRQEAGVLSTEIGISMDTSTPNKVMIVWIFKDYAAFQSHLLSDHCMKYIRLAGPMIVDSKGTPCKRLAL